MVILGIDPGLAIVGYGVILSERGKVRMLDYGVINTPAKESVPVRLKMINEALIALIEKFKPDEIAVEELFFSNNQKTAIMVAEARGVILMTAIEHCGRLYEYTPMQIKQAVTGWGGAEKKQIQLVIKQLLTLKDIPRPDDAADALAVAVTHAQTNRLASLFSI